MPAQPQRPAGPTGTLSQSPGAPQIDQLSKSDRVFKTFLLVCSSGLLEIHFYFLNIALKYCLSWLLAFWYSLNVAFTFPRHSLASEYGPRAPRMSYPRVRPAQSQALGTATCTLVPRALKYWVAWPLRTMQFKVEKMTLRRKCRNWQKKVQTRRWRSS